MAGVVWTHGDLGYANAVFRDEQLVGLIDWEFAAPADPGCDTAALLAMDARGPRLGADDQDRRVRAVRLAFESIVNGYEMGDTEMRRLPMGAALVLEDAVELWLSRGVPAEDLAHLQWRARWFREHEAILTGG